MAASKQDRGITFRNPSRPGGGIDSTISVRASEENNNTVLVCRVNTGDSRNVVDSDPAVLKVQGNPLDASIVIHKIRILPLDYTICSTCTYRSLGPTWRSDSHEHKQQCHCTNLDSLFHSGHHRCGPRHQQLHCLHH